MLSDNQGRASLFSALDAYPLPVGVYVVRMVEGVEAIVNCNAEFARLFGFPSVEAAHGTQPRLMHYSDRDYQLFMFDLRKAGSMLHHTELLKRQDGTPMLVELHVQLDYDEQHNVIGRTGVVLDHSEFETLLKDVGQFMHNFTSTLTGFDERLRGVRDAFTPPEDPFGDLKRMPTPEEVNNLIDKPAAELKSSMQRLISEANSDERKREAFSDDDWETLNEIAGLLEIYKEKIDDLEHRPPTLRDAARMVIEVMGRIEKGSFANETIRGVRQRASEIERLVSLYMLHLTIGTLLELTHQVNMQREVLLNNIRNKEAEAETTITDLITTARLQMQDFAFSRDIELRTRDRSKRMAVKVNRRDMQRAIQNLLHNAIKYSWSKRDDRPWVEIRAFIDGGFVVVEIENYGVPIPRREIESGDIFKLGVRGRMSSDRARMGTGIGLYDAQTVARQHGGDISLVSSPARPHGDPDDLNQPFVTIATLKIPIPKGF
ncbi:MAG: ATP-binding protein [Anaerolineae bacterium]